MIAIIISVLVISAIAAGLAAVLVAADMFISNYGICDITINDERTVSVDGGSSLLDSLMANQIFVPSACGGRGTCAYCKVKVLEGGGPLMPTEEPYLNEEERRDAVRLSCQVKVRNSLRIEIPEELLSIKEYVCVCIGVRDLAHDVKEFRFKLKEPAEISYIPGQYVQLLAPAYDGNEEVYRAYSISFDPAEKNMIELVIRLIPGGICTTWCFKYLKVNEQVKMNGPYGEFHLSNADAPMLFVAGGSGMAPIKSMLHQMKNTGDKRDTTYFFGANQINELFYLDEMARFEKELPNFKFVPVVGNPEKGADWNGERGLVTEALDRWLNDASEYEAYLCGSPAMIDAAIAVLTGHGMNQENIFHDKFA